MMDQHTTEVTDRAIHTFDNGLRVYVDQLEKQQRKRYARCNLHEPEEEAIFLKLIDELPPDGCFVNVGSAIGYYAMLAKRRSPGLTVHAVEPFDVHRRFFRENLKLNGFGAGEIVLHDFAVGERSGRSHFLKKSYGSQILGRADAPHAGTALFSRLFGWLRKPAPPDDNVSVVRTITLGDLLETVGRPINLLQMDVQGLEVDILRGGEDALRSGRIKRFLIGTHGDEIHAECRSRLTSAGYPIEIDDLNPEGQPDGILLTGRRD